jgi:hypothetical protein
MIGSGNAVILDDGSMTASSATLTSASGPFSAADVGKTVGVIGAGASGVTLISTISSFTNSTQVTLASAASTTVSNAHFAFGTDDTSALSSFFAANVGKTAALDPNAKYISTSALTSQLKLLDALESTIIFLIANNTDNCFTVVPPKPLAVEQIASRAVYKDLYLDGMATGLDLLFERDGSMRFDGLTLDNSWRDAIMLNPRATNAEAIENLTGIDWIVRNAGRHGMHVNLSGAGLSSPAVYCNETNIFAFEIRSIGRRFTGANALRFTHDDIVIDASKISHFFVIGANWDGDQARTLGGNSLGDMIFHDAINGTTVRRVENFRLEPGGMESTSGTVTGKMVLNGSNFTVGDWIESYIEQGQTINWGIGVPDAYLSDPEWGNEYVPNVPLLGKYYRRFIKLPNDGRSIISGDTTPNGGYIDPAFKNAPTLYVTSGVMVASGDLSIDIPIRDVNGGAFQYAEWPVRLCLSNNPFYADATKWTYAEYAVMISYTANDGIARVGAKLMFDGIGADPTVSFTPANVTFSLPNTTTLRITVPGGANVGSSGADPNCHAAASRWGMVVGEAQRTADTGTQLSLTI